MHITCEACGHPLVDCPSCSEGAWMGHGVIMADNGCRYIGMVGPGHLSAPAKALGSRRYRAFHLDCWNLAGRPDPMHTHAWSDSPKSLQDGAHSWDCMISHGFPIPRPANAGWFDSAPEALAVASLCDGLDRMRTHMLRRISREYLAGPVNRADLIASIPVLDGEEAKTFEYEGQTLLTSEVYWAASR